MCDGSKQRERDVHAYPPTAPSLQCASTLNKLTRSDSLLVKLMLEPSTPSFLYSSSSCLKICCQQKNWKHRQGMRESGHFEFENEKRENVRWPGTPNSQPRSPTRAHVHTSLKKFCSCSLATLIHSCSKLRGGRKRKQKKK